MNYSKKLLKTLNYHYCLSEPYQEGIADSSYNEGYHGDGDYLYNYMKSPHKYANLPICDHKCSLIFFILFFMATR